MTNERPPIQLQGLGWRWTADGPVLSVQFNGQRQQVLVPLRDVWIAFDQELAAVGCPTLAAVGAPMSVGGLFGGLKRAFSRVVPKAVRNVVSKAASTVSKVAKGAASAAFRHATLPINMIRKGPAAAIKDLVRKDLRLTKAITNNPAWNIAATGVSFIPGVGQGVSAGMAAAAAAGRGESLRDIGLAAAKNALPGGPVAAAAFDVALGVAKGQKLDQIALNTVRNQLPGGPAAKAAFDVGLRAARGEKINPAAVAAAVAPAVGLQKAVAITSKIAAARAAAQKITRGIASPADRKVAQQGFLLTKGIAGVVAKARAGDQQASILLEAIKQVQAARNKVQGAARPHQQMHPQQPPRPVARRPVPSPAQALRHRSPVYAAPQRPAAAPMRSPWQFTAMGPSPYGYPMPQPQFMQQPMMPQYMPQPYMLPQPMMPRPWGY